MQLRYKAELGNVLDPLHADVGHGVRPGDGDQREGQAAGAGFRSDAFEYEERGDESVDRDPADLQQAHQQARHQVAALSAEGRTADDIQRVARLHAEHGGHAVEESVAQQTGHGQGKQTEADASLVQRAFGDVLVENDPQEDARIGRRGVDVPRRAVGSRIRHCFRDVVRQHGYSSQEMKRRPVYSTISFLASRPTSAYHNGCVLEPLRLTFFS